MLKNAAAVILTVSLLTVPQSAVVQEAHGMPDNKTKAFLTDVCRKYNVSPELVQAIIEKESRFDPLAVGDHGESVGLMQIQPKWHKERMKKLHINNLKNPKQNILVGVDYLAELFEKYEDPYAVLMAYNEGNTKRFHRGIYSDYAVKITTKAAELEEKCIYNER